MNYDLGSKSFDLSPQIFREPYLDRPNHYPFEPSPMTWATGEDFAYQNKVNDFIVETISTGGPDYVRQSVRDAIALNYFGTQASLLHRNYEAYCDVSMNEQGQQLAADDISLLERAKESKATQFEIISLLRSTNLKAAELTKLTHPYGERANFLPAMYECVGDALLSHGGEMDAFSFPEPSQLKLHSHEMENDHFIVTTRDEVGSIEDVVIKERRAFAIQADVVLGFDKTILSKMQLSSREDGYEKWRQRFFEETGVREYISDSLSQMERPDYVLPISTVIYGHRRV